MGAEFLIVIRRNERLSLYPPDRADINSSLTIEQVVRELTAAGWQVYRPPHTAGGYEDVVLERNAVIDRAEDRTTATPNP